MAIPEERLQLVMSYCKVDNPDDEKEISDLHNSYDSAVAYLSVGGVSEPNKADKRHALWIDVVLALTLDDFDHRGSQLCTEQLTDNKVFRRKLNLLKMTEPVS